ncbi:bone morphogenetic protein 10 [Tribolium castaneum]|uniref:Bone morphogenetic protein 10 n=2 Tax=Tribolium castaneum TaxID=7070 RepID=D6WXA0_TRICA|nr:PREDICTED: bone morphogenetic protein 10 isoform X2 [Tribolium castaneum]EFA09252.1 bone morphogenetic protein 10 [Tribolium castaneum]|eukprot:XP_973577.1 PREDICTED: bone morphogenetic protein 10 isoform X2 [Tribolium castaneum]
MPNVFILVPLVILLWISLLLLLKNSLNTSIQLDINTSTNTLAKIATKIPNRIENTVPVNKKKYHVPKFMLELYEQNKVKRDNLTRPDVVRSLTPKHAGPIDDNEVLEESENHLLIFDLPNVDEEEQFVSAELKILTLVEVKSGVERQLVVSIYDDVTKKFHHLEQIHVYHMNDTWISFNVTQPVVKILQKTQGQKYLKVVISVRAFLSYYKAPKSDFKLSLMPVEDDFDHDYPILLLSYTSNNKNITRRKKRSLEDDYEEETNKLWDDDTTKKIQAKKMKKVKNSCRRKPLYINFSEINFDLWILQPPGYEAYQCQGKCFYPVAEHLNPTKHAIVQALLHSVSPSKVSRSCCVPTNLDSISILYVDNNGVLTYRYAYKDMVVLECGCR